jgi:hypothetical protein
MTIATRSVIESCYKPVKAPFIIVYYGKLLNSDVVLKSLIRQRLSLFPYHLLDHILIQ